MPVWVTPEAILVQAGAPTAPAAPDTEWATICADAVNAGIDAKLVDSTVAPNAPEIIWIALGAGVEAYKRREAVFGVTGYSDLQGVAIRIARDYLEAFTPIFARYTLPGIG